MTFIQIDRNASKNKIKKSTTVHNESTNKRKTARLIAYNEIMCTIMVKSTNVTINCSDRILVHPDS